MAASRADLSRLIPLMMEAARRPFYGTVLTLGRMDLAFGYGNVRNVAREFDVSLRTLREISLSRFPKSATLGCISDSSYFRLMGFSDHKVLDVTDYEDADYICDLNGKIPEGLIDRFDTIIDAGTLEHVFDLPRTLKNIFSMLRIGGRIIHIGSPASNGIDHGFYSFSPTLFHDYYTANKLEINGLYLIRAFSRRKQMVWDLFRYDPGGLDNVSGGGLGPGQWMILCIVTKTAVSRADVIPQQNKYVHTWKHVHLAEWNSASAEDPYFNKWRGEGFLNLTKLLKTVKRRLERYEVLFRVAQSFHHRVSSFRDRRRSTRLQLPRVRRILLTARIEK